MHSRKLNYDVAGGGQHDFTIGHAVFSRLGEDTRRDEGEPLLDSKPEKGARGISTPWLVCIGITLCLAVSGGIVALIVTQTGDNDSHHHHQHTHQPTAVPTTTTTVAPATTTGATPPPATPASNPVLLPIDLAFLCNVAFENGTCRAIFSYENPNAAVVSLPVGANNYIEPGPPGRGQRTEFKSGYHFGGATFLWNCEAHAQVRWTLRSGGSGSATQSTAPQAAVDCPALPIHQTIAQATLFSRKRSSSDDFTGEGPAVAKRLAMAAAARSSWQSQ